MKEKILLRFVLLTLLGNFIFNCRSKKDGDSNENPADDISPITGGYTPAPDVTSNQNSPIGTNLHNFSYFRSSEWFFIDAMMKSSRWFPISSDGFDKGNFSVDSHGWPTGKSGSATELIKFFFQQIDGHYPSGTYVLLWDGEDPGWELGGDASNLNCDSGEAIGSCSSGRSTFSVNMTTAEGFALSLQTASIHAGNYPKNVRVLLPGGVCGRSVNDLDLKQYCASQRGGNGTCDDGETCFDFEDVYWNRFSDSSSSLSSGEKIIFHPLTLERLSPYSTIRTMEPLGINFGNEIVSWSDRGQLADDTFGHNEKGCAPEILFALGNVLAADLWINMPHKANDEYVRSFAELALDQLSTDRTIYLEYTNEHWNSADEYPQSQYMLAQADALGVGVGQSEANRKSLFYSQRATAIFKIWRDVFSSNVSRVQRVLGAMIAQPNLTELMLSHADVAENVDHIAVGHYLGLYLIFDHFETLENMSLDDLFEELFNGGLASGEASGGAVAEVDTYQMQQKEIIDQYKKSLIAYEGGQHFWYNTTEDNGAISALFEAANRDNRMEDLYTSMLTKWRDGGGQLFMHFYNIGPYHRLTGNFGAMEYQDADPNEYPKMRAILKFITDNPRWW